MTPEQQQVINDHRELFNLVDFGIDVKAFIGSRIGKMLIEHAERERDEAIDKLRDADPTNAGTIMQLQSTIKRAESIQLWMANAIQDGINAQSQLVSMDQADDD